MISTITPNPSFDRTLSVETIDVGGVNRATAVTVEAGGKGINISRALADAGVPTRCVFPANAADEANLRTLLGRRELIEYVAVPMRQAIRQNISVIEPDGRTTKLNEPGDKPGPAVRDGLIEHAIASAGSSRWLVCSGSLPQGMSDDFYAEVVERAGGLGAMIAIDTSGEPLRQAAASGCDLLKPNVSELEYLVGRDLETIGDVVRAAVDVVAGGVGAVVVSMGADGALYVDADHRLHATTPPTEVRNTVGAGDALLAGFVSRDRAPAEALATGVAWGRAAVESDTTSFVAPTEGAATDVHVDTSPDLERVLEDE